MAQKSNSAGETNSRLPPLAWKQSLARELVAWYRRHQRDLPWRKTRDPYSIWVSEIMLQQTQVATVIPYFLRFLRRFPTVATLAAADEHDVLRHWEGLGYYRRARQLHRAARVLVDEHGGQLPCEEDVVRALPGVGRYTAGAIMSIAFDARAPIVEANTARLFSRLAGYAGDITTSAGVQFLWAFAEHILPTRNCRTFNQALMELGSLVCTPRAPQCDGCPVRELCVAFQRGQQDKIPRPRRKPTIEAVREASVAVWRGKKVLVRQREPGERWAGLWDFLRFPLVALGGKQLAGELTTKIHEQSGLAVATPTRVTTIKHGVTRFRITLDCYSARCTTRRPRLPRGAWRWLAPDELADVPLSVTGRKFSRLLLADAPDC